MATSPFSLFRLITVVRRYQGRIGGHSLHREKKDRIIKSVSLILANVLVALSLAAAAQHVGPQSPMKDGAQVVETAKDSGSGNLEKERASSGADATSSDSSDFALGIRPTTIATVGNGSARVIITTDEYNLTVDWSQPRWVDYRIQPHFTNDYVGYRRVNPQYPGEGTIDELRNPLDSVDMSVSSWGIIGNDAWFVESSQEFSLNQSYALFRDYMELNVTYTPGTKEVLTTYAFALFSKSGEMYDMFDGGYHRYMPGYGDRLPGYGMGGWYPTWQMFAPAADLRVPHGDLGVEWGYSDEVAYIASPIWQNVYLSKGDSAFALKFSSLNSVVPNIGLGTQQTFHMFVRPYQYNDGKDKGSDMGYAQWVANEIARKWVIHNKPIFPLVVMDTSRWSPEFRDWVESSQVKVAPYSSNASQITWNYASASRTNREPCDDPSSIPSDWQVWLPGNVPEIRGDNCLVLNPVSGTFRDVGSFRHHLIEDNPYNDWFWSSDGIFWDEMNNYDPWTNPRNDFHNRTEFIYNGFLRLVEESYESGHWNFTITNPYTALLHLAMVSDLSLVEAYTPSSTWGENFTAHVQSTMQFINNMPKQHRPGILVYQYYDSDVTKDQNVVYRAVFDSARHGFNLALVAWSPQSTQMHNLRMAEKMYIAMGASRDNGVQIPAETIDLDVAGGVDTGRHVVVWTGNIFSPDLRFLSQYETYSFTNLRSSATTFGASIDTRVYYGPSSSALTGRMTFFPDGKAWFNGSILPEETANIRGMDAFQVEQLVRGSAIVNLSMLSRNRTSFTLSNLGGSTRLTIKGLSPATVYVLLLNGTEYMRVASDSSGITIFEVPGGNAGVFVLETGDWNRAPEAPSVPTGATSGYRNTTYAYSSSATDPENDQVKITIDWGDGTQTESGYVDSGTMVTLNHQWISIGSFCVKVMATDTYGAASDWSSCLTMATTSPSNPGNPGDPGNPENPTVVPTDRGVEWTTPVTIAAFALAGIIMATAAILLLWHRRKTRKRV